MDILTKKVNEVMESIESMCTISLCLMESQCMQIRAEEQEDEDKQKIALMGQKDSKATKSTTQQPDHEPQLGDMFRTNENSFMSATDRGSPRVTRPDKSPREDIETYKSMVGPKYDFPQPSGSATSPNNKGT